MSTGALMKGIKAAIISGKVGTLQDVRDFVGRCDDTELIKKYLDQRLALLDELKDEVANGE